MIREYLNNELQDELTVNTLLENVRRPMVDAGLPSQLAINLTNNTIKRVCTFIRMNFKKLLEYWCLERLKTNEISRGFGVKYQRKIAKALAIELAGKSGTGSIQVDDDVEEEDNDDDESSPWTFAEYIDKIFKRWTFRPGEREFVMLLKQIDRVEEYIPDVLRPGRDTWTAGDSPMGWKAWVSNQDNIISILQFVHAVNDHKFIQQLFIQPNTKSTSVVLSTTTLAFIWCRFIKSYPSQVQALLNQYHGDVPQTLRKSISGDKWIKHPSFLWSLVFPGIQIFQERHPNLVFGNAGCSDGGFLNLMFYNTNTRNAHKKESAAVKKHGCVISEFNSKDFRFHGIRNLSDLVGVWHKGKKRKPKGLAAMDGFKGVIDFEKNYSYFGSGVEALKQVVDHHPLVGIDLGVVSHVSMVVLNGSLAENETVFTGRWIEKLFSGKAAYNGVDEYVNKIQEEQQENNAIERLAETKSRTNDVHEYQRYCQVFNEVSPPMIETAYSGDFLRAKFKKNRKKQRYYHSIANRILSQCHAIAPEKQGAPILMIGKPTFSSSMKGKRAAPPKQVIKYLSRFFTVLIVGEFQTSQFCGQCESKMETYQQSIRMYTCNCQRSDGGGPLIVNKDRSAALAMVRIATNLLAHGSRPRIYCPIQDPESQESQDQQIGQDTA